MKNTKAICLPISMIVIFLSGFSLKYDKGDQTNSGYSVKFSEFRPVTDASLRAIYVINKKVIWASGSKGTFLLSTDGGKTWRCGTVPGEIDNDFRSLHAWDRNRALVFGTGWPAKAYLTSDGGKTWTKVYENNIKGIFFNSIKFADNLNGIALSDPTDDRLYVIKTDNGGITWARLENIPQVKSGEGSFAASNTCIDYKSSGKAWLVSGSGNARVFYTINNGARWDVTETPVVHDTPASGIFSVCFLNDQTGAIVGGTYDKMERNQDIAAYSTDGGATWHGSDTMPAGFRSCLIWLKDGEKDILFAIGPTGSDYSTDYGMNWKFSGERGYHTMMAIKGTSKGYAAGSMGRIAKFTLIKNQ